jgi:predicted DNA-binding transcriptional regulator YafY
MRASRLLSLLMLLQSRGRLSATTLAATLEVSTRTILRDIDELSAAGVPVWAERGREGGFQLAAGWSTRLTGLTEPESQALFLAGIPSAASELGLGAAAASARVKMLNALPETLRENALRVSARVHFDPNDWFRAVAPSSHLQAVADAVWHCRPIRVRYLSWRGEREYALELLGLVLKAGVWYFVAARADKPAPAIFRLAAVQAITPLEGHFERPEDFDLAAFWQAATRRFETEIYRDSATLRVSSSGMKQLLELSTAIQVSAQQSARPDPQGSGWTQVQIPTESIEHAARQLIALGAEVEVLAPEALRLKMQQTVNQMRTLYSA